jgi:hypothetical protein
MRTYIQFFLFLTLLIVLPFGTAFADETTNRLESRVIEAFDGPGDAFYEDGSDDLVTWRVFGSKFVTDGYPEMIYASKTWPIDLHGVSPEDADTLGTLGIHARFNRKGYNQIDIIPGVGEGENWQSKPLPLPGRVQLLDFWVWGSEYDYTIEFYFMDYEGRQYRMVPVRSDDKRYAGSINFTGWKNMYIEIPGYIRQAQKYKPSHKTLSLTKITIATHPEEKVDDFYFYIDHIKVLSDFQETFYDGYDLANPERVEEIWGTTEETTNDAIQ